MAGGLAQKLGIFAMAMAFLKKGWFLIFFAIAGLWKVAARMFGGKTSA
jgi:uncharacterized membrane-anchored protein